MATERSSLREELLQEKQKECSFKELLDSMPKDLREEVLDCLNDPRFSTAAVVRALTKRGYKTNRHRINECKRECECGVFSHPPREGL